MDGDGAADLVVADHPVGPASVISVLLNDGHGAFGASMDFPVGKFAYVVAVAVGDLNGDGLSDLALADEAGGIEVLLNSSH